MIRPVALALVLLALLLAAPAGFPRAAARSGTPDLLLQKRISNLEAEVDRLSRLALPEPVVTDQYGLVPDAAFSSPNAFLLVCRTQAATAGQRVLQPPTACVRPGTPRAP